jgi:hypothetical protein
MANLATIQNNILADSGIDPIDLIVGTGTVNYIPKFTAEGAIGDSIMSQSGSNILINGNIALHAGNYNNYAPTLTGGGASGTWGINISGVAAQVTINYNNDSNSTYQMLWGSGNSIYGSSLVYLNPFTDTIYAAAYKGSNNVGGTGEASYHPAGIFSQGTNWLYGTMYRAGYDTYHANGSLYQVGLLELNNGFQISQVSGNNYGQFNNWVFLPGNHGFYSGVNNAHILPNDGTYGPWRIIGTRGGYNGIEFDASNGRVVLMVDPNSNGTGFHNNNYGWQFLWSNGSLYVYKNAYGGGTNAVVLDSVNYTSYAVPTSGYTFGNAFTIGTMYVSTGIQSSGLSYVLGTYSNGYAYRFDSTAFASWIGLGGYLPLAGGAMTGKIYTASFGSDAYGGAMEIRERGYVGDTQSDWSYSPAISFHWGNRFAVRLGFDYNGYLAVDNVRFLNANNYNSYAPTLTGGGASGTWGINITGNAASANYTQLLDDINNYTWSSSSLPLDFPLGMQLSFVGPNSGEGSWQNYGTIINARTYSAGGGSLQMYVPYGPSNGGDALQVRFGNYNVSGGNAWTGWKTLLQSDNYNNYAPTLTGGGASGTWGINITGNAGSATTAVNLYGPGGSTIRSSSVGTSYVYNYQIRENDGGYGNSDINYAPQLAFHWGNVVASSILMESSGRISIRNNPGTGYEDFIANTVYGSTALRAPIFYDSEDISFYVNPNGFSRISNLITTGYLYVNNSDPTIYFQDTDHRSAMIHVNSNIFYVLRGSGVNSTGWSTYNGYWPLQISLENNDATFGGSVSAPVGDFRAPIFYDSQNTAYYLDPNSTSNLSTVYAYSYQGNGNVSGTGSASYHPSGIYSTGNNLLYGTLYMAGNNMRSIGGIVQNDIMGRPNAQWGAGGTNTGAVVIKFPGGSANYGMVHAVIDIYEYNGNNVATVIVGGHNWNSYWVNYGANVIGYTDKPVRVGFKDGQYCIVIGNASSTWSYGQVVLRKIQNGTYYSGVMDVGAGYTISMETDTYTWISADLRQLRVPGNIYMNETLVATQSWVNSQGFVTGGPYVPTRGVSNWNDGTVINYVVGMLGWKYYGGNHVIFDASAGTSPSGTSVNNTNSQAEWTATYPTLMGWNGSQTYGVRVDRARLADNIGINYNNDSNGSYQVLWGSGNSIYGTSGVYVNPYYDALYATTFSATSDITSSSGQGRFGGWYTGTGYTGTAVEAGVSGGSGNVIAYNRDSGSYQTLFISASNLYLRQQGGYVWINSQLVRESAGIGWLSGNYSSSETSNTTGAIYSIGGSYYPTGASLNTMYGVGYTNSSQGQMPSGASSWGFYVAANGVARVWLGGDSGNINATGTVYSAAYRGNANVGGTGEAVYAPAGLYSTGTNWLYGTIFMNNNVIYDAGTIHLNDSSRSFLARYVAGSNIYSATLNWYGLQLGNNGDNYIIAGRTNPGGQLRFYVNNTSDFTSVNGTLTAIMFANGNTTFGSGSDYGYKFSVDGSLFATSWIRVNGTAGFYFETYGGGWYMTDNTYVRMYNGKSLRMEGGNIDYVNSIYMNGGVYIQTYNDRNLVVKSTGNADIGILGKGSGDQFGFQIYGYNGSYGFLGSAFGSYDLKKIVGGGLYMNNDETYYINTSTSGYSAFINGAVISNSSFGTNGYGASSNAATGRMYGPKGGAYSSTTYANYGAIKIRLPFRANNLMWSMKVRIYDYQLNRTSEYTFGNYSYSAGGYNYSAAFMGSASATPRDVRFGNDGSYDCVWIGETSDTWYHPVISVMDFTGGFVNGSVQNYHDNWDVSIVGSFGTVAATINPSARFSDVIASTYYDADNTSYYLNPSNFSNLYSATFNSTVNFQGTTSWFGGYGPGSGPGMQFENQGSFLRMAFWGLDFYDWNNGRQMLIDNGYVYVDNYLQAGNSLRAPIFYDSADTGYYLDPNGTSFLNNVGAFTIKNNYGVSTDHTFGIYFSSDLSPDYAIFRESGAWSSPYPDLRIAFYTGIKIGAETSYGGVRFYQGSNMGTLVLSVNDSSYNTGGIYVHGTAYASAYYETSDARVKTIIEEDSRVKGIESIRPKLYKKDGKIEFGYIAQDFLDIMPYALNNKNIEELYNLSYREVHTAKIAYLEDKIKQLEEKLNSLY